MILQIFSLYFLHKETLKITKYIFLIFFDIFVM